MPSPKRPRSATRRQTDTDLTRLKTVAYTVCGGLGVDTAGFAIPYLASWAQSAEPATIDQTAALIDRLARRIEHALEGDSHRQAQNQPAASAGAEHVPPAA